MSLGSRPSTTWFSDLFGFREDSYRSTVDNFELLEGDTLLRSRVNGQTFRCGAFSTPSLAELRERALAAGPATGEVTLSHAATQDILEEHSKPENEGALFQVASQFNCLEFPSPTVTPENGVTAYESDRTQGPACSLAAPAATVYRNYFARIRRSDGKEQRGQTRDAQIDTSSDLSAAITALAENDSGEQGPPDPGPGGGGGAQGAAAVAAAAAASTAADPPPGPFWDVCNGYTFSSRERLAALAAMLKRRGIAASEGKEEEEEEEGEGEGGDRDHGRDLDSRRSRRDALLGHVRVGLHSCVGVAFASRARTLRRTVTVAATSAAEPPPPPPQDPGNPQPPPGPPDSGEEPVVSQAFCSAVSCAYAGPVPTGLWEPLARLVLDAAYEATLWAGVLEAAEGRGSGRVLLTKVGGGVFGNEPGWVAGAVGRAVARVRAAGVALEVVLVHHRRVDAEVEGMVARAVEECARRAAKAK